MDGYPRFDITKMHAGCPPNCNCDHYCLLRSMANRYGEHDEKIQHLFGNKTAQVDLQFCGVNLHLESDGTTSGVEGHLEDTTGG